MRKNKFCLIFIILILFGIVFVGSASEYKSKISPDLYKDFNSSTKIKVIIKLKEIYSGPHRIQISSSDEINNLKKIVDRGEYFSAYVTEDELNKIQNSDSVDYVSEDREIRTMLQNSTVIVNATTTWNLQFSGLNLTGAGQTVCILDTGVNSSHPDLNGKVIAQYCYCSIKEGASPYCCPGGLNESADASDNNGHGTHVSGIIAASGAINGVAKGANIVMIKIMNSSGSGDGVDLIAGLEWCINNATEYNISAISMSLGDGTQNNNYCDNLDAETTSLVNQATLKNISVVIASGNDAWNNYINWPACIQNATPVSATDKSDNIATAYADRNWMVKLFAPGGGIGGLGSCTATTTDPDRICSTYKNGGYASMSGTSMATPHVAAAIAIINQFLKATNRTRTPQEIEDILYNTGKRFSEGVNNYSRINIYAAIISLDNIAPNVSLISPGNNTINSSVNQTFSCNATDLQLANITFYLWNSSDSLVYNSSQNVSGASNVSFFNVTNLKYDNYKWNCLANDLNNNSAFASSNFSLTIKYIISNLNSPSNGLYTNQNQTYNCSFLSENSHSLKNSTFYLWNSSGSLFYNSSQNITGLVNTSIFNYNFTTEGNYSWNCLVFNNNSQSIFADNNFSLSYDVTPPNISSIETSVTTTTATLTWNSSESTNSSVIYGLNSSNENISNDPNFTYQHIISLSGLTSFTTYYYNITSCDAAGNCIINGTYNFTTSAEAQVLTTGCSGCGGGGGGGGSVSTANTYTVKDEEITSGYNQDLGKNDKIVFSVPNENSGGHSLIVNQIKDNSVNITVRSSPVIITLNIGESKKINLSSPNYYDLYVKLNEIVNNKANITLRTIHEDIISKEIQNNNSIEKPANTPESNNSNDTNDSENKNIKNLTIMICIILLIIIIIAVFIIVLLIVKKRKIVKKEKHIKEYKNLFKSNLRLGDK